MNILDLIIEKIDERYTDVTADLSLGAAKSLEEYKYLCGVLHGMKGVKSYIQELKVNLEDED